ncbi:SDR family NAD(P)-dependent oxidoreductase [Sphingosinicella terrae]|uniref:SDR family NAD(P)-dependent oxidoreductase n=1 Tax=Sphingosinicella terrae TaxID=2172047 RepID=UPI000E0D7408|nr:SDR family NAD(P)-dependent oxidoreductase [Sphingosinicella terrae]
MKDLAGRTAFVTGGANGIGLGLARVLLDQGCKVVIADIREESIEQALATLDNREVTGIRLDVASRETFAAAADEAEARMGPVSLLFNNAGINLFRPIDESSYEDWDWVLGVNLFGVINGVQTFVPRMKARGEGGHVVNTASMASFLASGVPGIYNCSKYAVRGLSESLRHSLHPHGIGVSVLCPGLVRSEIYRSDEIRPAAHAEGGNSTDPGFVEMLGQVHQIGMDPVEVAEKTIAAVKANRFYIFPHPEFKEELEEVFDQILAKFPDETPDPQRIAFEQGRRDRYAQERALLKGE